LAATNSFEVSFLGFSSFKMRFCASFLSASETDKNSSAGFSSVLFSASIYPYKIISFVAGR
jgi:hypothetical protein